MVPSNEAGRAVGTWIRVAAVLAITTIGATFIATVKHEESPVELALAL
jgi:hypothetical protein